MPIVRLYPVGEVSPQPLPNAQLNVPAAGDINLFGGNRAQDLQLAGQRLGQASDSLFSIHERKAKAANDVRVQDANNQYIDATREILRTGPDAYYRQSGADAIVGAGATIEKLTTLKDRLLGQAPNDYQRRKLRPILDTHLAASADAVARHANDQQAAYGRTVAAAAIETSRTDAVANPANLPNAMHRAEGAARALYEGQAPEVVETEGRKAGLSLVSAVIGDQLGRNDPEGLALFRQYRDQLDPRDRHVLGAAAEMLANTIAAADWLRDRSASLAAAPVLTGDAALDAVNVASASVAEPPPVTSWSGRLLEQEGVAGHRQRLAGIEDRRRALTALNEQEFAGDPVRRRANQTAIDTDAAWNRAAAKAEADKAYADLQRHLTTGGPGGGPAVTLPPATLLSRFTDAQQDAVAAQVNRAIEGRKTRTDLATWYAIHQGLTSDDADERERWADTNFVQFRGELSDEDLVASTRLQTTMRTDDGSAEATRQQAITRMSNRALLAAGIDPTPTQDRAPEGQTMQAATFRRALDDDLSTFESSTGRPATAAEAQDIVDRLARMALNGGWLKVSDRNDFLIKASNPSLNDDASNRDSAPQPDTEAPAPAGQDLITVIDVPTDPESYERFLEEHRLRTAAQQAAPGTGGSNGTAAPEPHPGSPEYQVADAQARAIVAEQGGNPSEVQRAKTTPPPASRAASIVVPMPPEMLPGAAVLEKLVEAVSQAARSAAALAGRATAAAAGVTVGAVALIVTPFNSGNEYVSINDKLRVRTSPGQDAKLERRIDDGLLGTDIGAHWEELRVGAAWAYEGGRRYVAIDRLGLERAIGRNAADAALGGSGIAMAKPPSKDDGGKRDKPGPGHNSESFDEKLTPEPRDEEPKPPLNPTPLVPSAIDGAESARIVTGEEIDVPLATAAGEGYISFDAFKRVHKSAGPGYEWHHIVGQHAANVERFGPLKIHNTNNIVRLPKEIHWRINGHNASSSPFAKELTVREWLAKQSFEKQAAYGREMIEVFRKAPK